MKTEKKSFMGLKKHIGAGAALALLVAGGGAGRTQAQASPVATNTERQTMTQSKFYCNIKALSPTGLPVHLSTPFPAHRH
jgi:hypothetical protein